MNKKQNLTALCVCFAGVAINLLLGMIASTIKLPLYLDTIGTVLISVMGGYFPGVVVGFATNFINSFSQPSALYFGVLNVLIAVCSAYFARCGYLKKVRGIIIAVLVFTFIGGGLGSLITWFIGSISFDNASFSGILLQTGVFNPFVAHFFSMLIINFIDKFVSVALVLLVLHAVPKKFYRYSVFNMWMQCPSAVDENVMKGKSNVRLVSLHVKLILVFIFSLLTVAIAGIYISMRIYYKATVDEHRNLALGTANLAAKVIDGDKVDDFLESRGTAEGYAETKSLLEDILFSSSEISYLYVYKMEEDGFHVVIDIETDDTPAGNIGDVLPYDKAFYPFIPHLLAGEDVEPIITNDEYGYLLTAAKPVFNSYGKCVCYAIADVDINLLIANAIKILVEMVTVFLSFFILLCAFVIWLSDYHIIFPVRALTMHIDDFSHTKDSQSQMDEYVKQLRNLDIHTGDEFERLFKSICQMTKSQAEQTRSIRQLSSSTAKMQDGLIITMANMVENRDSDTGSHIQKTTAYVKIIVEGLKEKGYYAEKITPKFIADVVRSAPLHDVGNINIPDGVLNKPGKLTDEEYEIMKRHTTEGKKIIEDAIGIVEGESYLKEARNMAAYHHERWNGTGYPEHLHGEVIPLSARIMAVADEFDALTSSRGYRQALPLEKALSIMEERKGTHFDAKCVEAFMDSLPKVKIILKKYNNQM